MEGAEAEAAERGLGEGEYGENWVVGVWLVWFAQVGGKGLRRGEGTKLTGGVAKCHEHDVAIDEEHGGDAGESDYFPGRKCLGS